MYTKHDYNGSCNDKFNDYLCLTTSTENGISVNEIISWSCTKNIYFNDKLLDWF